MWNKDIEVKDVSKMDNISNYLLTHLVADKFDIKRYEDMCYLCNRKFYGPTIKCKEKQCDISFHVECARLAKFNMDITDSRNKNNKHKHSVRFI
jgi:hypothetical protein